MHTLNAKKLEIHKKTTPDRNCVIKMRSEETTMAIRQHVKLA